MKKIILLLVIISMVASSALAGTVTRSFNPTTAVQGETLEVTLTVAPDTGENFYLFTEDFPVGWTVSDNGGLDDRTTGELKMVVTSIPADLTYTYILNVPATATSGDFSGISLFQGDTVEGTIGGPASISVISGPVCGNGVIEGGEDCDDGNILLGDGCSAACHVETGYTCIGQPSVCTPPTLPVCGNGILEGTEECDDGNIADGDGCSASCTVESGYACSGAPSVCVLAGQDCTVDAEITATSCTCGGANFETFTLVGGREICTNLRFQVKEILEGSGGKLQQISDIAGELREFLSVAFP